MNRPTRSPSALALVLLLVAAAAGTAAALQAPPSTDIWLAALDLNAAPATIGEATNLTDRDGYDNQPFFEPEGNGLLYTSQRGEQTDIYRIHFGETGPLPLTDTPESEYSPTVTPNGLELSVIRVEADGTQRLWSFRRDGSSPELLLPGVAPVGYHAWSAEEDLVLFVLGEPPTLQIADLAADSARVVAEDIGRSLHALPDGSGFSFLQRENNAWRIRALRLSDFSIDDLGPAFEESQDMAWTPDGRIVMASGSTVALREVDGPWQVLRDLAPDGVGSITRVAVHPEGTSLALVAERSS